MQDVVGVVLNHFCINILLYYRIKKYSISSFNTEQ